MCVYEEGGRGERERLSHCSNNNNDANSPSCPVVKHLLYHFTCTLSFALCSAEKKRRLFF